MLIRTRLYFDTAKTPEQLKKEEEEKGKKENEEDRIAGNRVRRAFGLPELSEAEYADMKKGGNNGSQQCWGFNGFPGHQGGYPSGGWGSGGAAGGGWMSAGAPPMIIAGGGGGGGPGWGGGFNNGNPANIIDVNIPLKQVFSRQTRNNQRRRYRANRRYYQLVPASTTSGSSTSRPSTASSRSRSSHSGAGRPGPPPSVQARAHQFNAEQLNGRLRAVRAGRK